MISIAIPSKNEIFLRKTILDILAKAKGEVEIFPFLDGYEVPEEELVKDPRVHYIKLPATKHSKKRHAINMMVNELCHGEYVMSVDAHCMFAEGFDLQLIKDHQPNWIQVPRRHRLDAENWCLQDQCDGRPPIDYEYIMFAPLLKDKALHGFKWDARSIERKDIMLDETMGMQASCWFMTKAWFQERGFMSLNYQGWGQENEELTYETYKAGGKLITNKNTWYAHLHKGVKYGRMYWMSRDENRQSYDYSYNNWVIENKEFFVKFINSFMPIPSWSKDWEKKIYG